MKKSSLKKIAMLLSLIFLLTACGGGKGANSGGKDAKETKVAESDFEKAHPSIYESAEDALSDEELAKATIKVAVVSDSSFTGIFNPYLYTTGLDNEFMRYTMSGAFPINEELRIILDSDETPIKVTVDKDNKTVSYKINPKFKWNNGEQVTTQDILRTYEIVANRDYITATQSIRYSEDMNTIEGLREYHEGKADKISGIEIIDDSNMVFHLKNIGPGVLWGGQFCGEFVNAKSLEGVAMDKILESDAIKKNPPSYGPYYMEKITAGESVILKANPHYYKGEPKIKTIVMNILPSSQVVASAQAGDYDIYLQTPTDAYDQLKDLKNATVISRPDLYLSYIGFKVGKWDSEKGEAAPDPNNKLNDKNLKRAMAMALDLDSIAENFYYGLRSRAKTVFPTMIPGIHDPNQEGIPYDLEGAKKLLEDSGYKDVDGDGIREGKDGNPLKFTVAMMSGSEVQEPLSQYFIQQWKEIGLSVELLSGRLMDLNTFYDKVQADDPTIEIFVAANGLASDPNPTGVYGKYEQFNMGRYTSERLQSALEKCMSEEAMDDAKRAEIYKEVENIIWDELPLVPMHTKSDIMVINNRIKHYDWSWADPGDWDWSKLEVTSQEPSK